MPEVKDHYTWKKWGHYYSEALDDSLNPSNLQIDKLKSKIKKVSLGGITAGNFLRGVDKTNLSLVAELKLASKFNKLM